MAHTRQPRTTQTDDLSATVRSVGRTRVVGRVLSSKGGMLLAGSDLEVDVTASFELEGPGFQFAGLVCVAQRTDHANDLHFLSWECPAYRYVCALIAARLRTRRTSDHAGRRDPRVRAPRGGGHCHPRGGRARARGARAAIAMGFRQAAGFTRRAVGHDLVAGVVRALHLLCSEICFLMRGQVCTVNGSEEM